jgi:hypothetical protein
MALARKLPLLNAENEAFWRGGAVGELRIFRCRDCAHWHHPPTPLCPKCGGLNVGPEPMSGRGRVASFTVNHQRWDPQLEVPFVIAIVELAEQPGLQFLTNIVGCAPEDVVIGMQVRVAFEQHEDIWLPLFKKDGRG